MNLVIAAFDIGRDVTIASSDLTPSLTVLRDEKLCSFGLRDCRRLLLDDVHAIMRCVAKAGGALDKDLVWRFSSVSTKCAELGDILTRWDTTGEPPILSFIGLDLGDCRHTTRGLTAFFGYEIAAKFFDASTARHAARNLVRLARYALMHGGLSRAESYQATDGATLDLIWSDSPTSGNVVTIVFRSIHNGPSSG